MQEETIVAVATPAGKAGVAIIRLSGPKAYQIALGLNGNKPLTPRYARFCAFYVDDAEQIDQGLILYFKAPHSFTGEDVVELHAHGSPVVLDLLLQQACALGARIAKPGEFSERAFLNDKIDLTQAEAIADLIQSNSARAARMALGSLQGEFSKCIHELCEALIHLRLYLEASLDFPEEEIDFLSDGFVAKQLAEILSMLMKLRSQAQQGVILREGLSLVITGRPNAGKSTLMNQLAGRELAIVTEVPGTTRDVMREHIVLDDIPLHLIDTAGLRHSEDLVEKEGIKRAWAEVAKADCILLVKDVCVGEEDEILSAEIQASVAREIPLITVFNKIDCLAIEPKVEGQAVYLSAQSGEGLSALKALIKQRVGYEETTEGRFLARRRHLEALDQAQQYLEIGQQQLALHRAAELVAEDLRLAHRALGEITGEFSSDDLLGRIFSSFCIGK
jgi:tRNA modification GTPase